MREHENTKEVEIKDNDDNITDIAERYANYIFEQGMDDLVMCYLAQGIELSLKEDCTFYVEDTDTKEIIDIG